MGGSVVVDLWQAIRVADLHGWILLVAEINRVTSRDLDGDEVWIMYWLTEEKDKGSAIQRFCDSSSAKCLSLILSGKEARQFNLALPLSTVHVDKRVPLKKKDYFLVHARRWTHGRTFNHQR